jgi:V/A-type H+-transporting ATPase subunit I
MRRVAVVAPVPQLAPALTLVSSAGVVELDLPAHETQAERSPRRAELDRVCGAAVRRGEVAGLVGWTPETELSALADRLADVGAAVVPVRAPAGAQPPTRLPAGRAGRQFDLLVETYTTVPYRDLDPSLVAGIAYVAMFGMMFGDVGHGALLLVGAVLVKGGRLPGRLGGSAGLRRSWPFLAGGGLASMLFGALYGEMFGPTHVLPVLWLDPLERPVPMLLAAVGVGAVLIGGAYALGTANRAREGGWAYALYARTGVAGSLLFVALALLVAGMTVGPRPLVAASVVLAVAGLGLAFVGLLVESGGGAAGVIQSVVELFDLVIRLGSNVVSFARLAAFGLTHAALGTVVWQGTTALWDPGVGMVAAAMVFVLGNALTFALEALVAGIQALRLEYYELFSRVFAEEGRPFRPWHLPEDDGSEDASEDDGEGVPDDAGDGVDERTGS